MKRSELEKIILERYQELKQINLRNLKKEHLEDWVNQDKVILPTSVLVKIFSERNERATTNKRLNNENVSLIAKLQGLGKSITDWSKSEIIQVCKKVFGTTTKADDELLGEIGAVSKKFVREDMEKAEQIVDDAQTIAEQYQKKYGEL